jgi:hypothetical protein
MAIKDDEAFLAMQARLSDLLPRLNERDRRLAMATEAKSWGRGGSVRCSEPRVRRGRRFGAA